MAYRKSCGAGLAGPQSVVDALARVWTGCVRAQAGGFVTRQQVVILKDYQKFHAPFQTTHIPRRKLVMAWAVMASPRRFLRTTNPWYARPQRMPASHRSGWTSPNPIEVNKNESA